MTKTYKDIALEIPDDYTPSNQVGNPYNLTPFNLTDDPNMPTRQWLLYGSLIRRYISMWLAPGGVGKSSYGFPVAMSLAMGRDFLGLGMPYGQDPLRVWIANLEDDQTELHRRAVATAKHHNISLADLGDRLFMTSGRQQPMKITKTDGAICPREILRIKDVITSQNLDVVIIDPFVHSHHAAENDNGAMAAVMEAWSEIADNTNTAIILVHHVRKGGGEITTDSMRGASSLAGAARVALAFNRMTDDEADDWGITNSREYFRTFIDKGNLAPAPEKSDWWHLADVELANGDRVGVVERWNPPAMTDGFPSDAAQMLQLMLQEEGPKRVSDQSPDWLGNSVAYLFDMHPDYDKRRIKKMIKAWLGNGIIAQEKHPDEKGVDRPFFVIGPTKI